MIGLIDSDILCYRVGFACEGETLKHARQSLDSFIIDLMAIELPEVFDFEFHLTGKNNFRYDIAVTKPYKGNRSNTPKPKHLQALRDHLVDNWDAIIHEGQEADDGLAIRQYELGDDSIIVSIDKDLDMVTGWHYNFNKHKKYYITKEEGLYKFYKQILTGDRVDNIQGVYMVGDKKADKLLAEAKTELDMWKVCVEAHGSFDRALEDARLLWMRSKEGEIWQPPEE
jgi:5'-3' exonuclease